MIIDAHNHIYDGPPRPEALLKRMESAGVQGIQLISLSPSSVPLAKGSYTSEERLENLMAWKGSRENIYPFYWIDPTEADAGDQVKQAAARGVDGFKISTNHFYPGDPRNMVVLQQIADARKPVLFHSGIFWDGSASSQYNRPAAFEALIEIDGLKFTLAHVSWPWCDECLAVYGKFLNMYERRPQASVEMFIDISPGTPKIYRKEVLTKLFTIGYDVENNIIFGSDSSGNDYNREWTKEWLRMDGEIMDELGVSSEIRAKLYRENFLRFIGRGEKNVTKRIQRVGEFS